MHVLVLTKGDERVASSRVRVWQVFRRLEVFGISGHIIHSLAYPWWSLSRKRFFSLRDVLRALQKNPDIVFIHKSFFPWDVACIVVSWCRVKRIPYVYDCDDAEWLHSPKKTRYFMRHATMVFAGSQHIHEYAKRYSAHVVLIPSVVDHERYENIAHDAQPPVIVWMGQGPEHFKSGNFIILRDALRALSKKGTAFCFVLIGGRRHAGLHDYWEHEFYSVRIIDDLDWTSPSANGDAFRALRPAVGVMPLADTPFVRAKCAYKAIEYMASGIPVVASSVGEAVPLLTHSRAGLLADTRDEWESALQKLLDHAELRKEMGEAGKKAVRGQYNYEASIPKIAGLLTSLRHP